MCTQIFMCVYVLCFMCVDVEFITHALIFNAQVCVHSTGFM
jgi:hypothetical protein